MAYKNFLLRLLFSIIFVITYLVILYINFSYVFYLIFLIYILIALEVLFYFRIYKVIPLLYIFSSFIFFLLIDFNNDNYLIFNLFILIVITFDIFSYITGKLFGRNKLINVSPNKTLEGLLGGFSLSIILSLLFLYSLKTNINYSYIAFILLTILFAFIGDIVESYYKRKNNLKNSSEFIPGHGGVFDRFDSFLFSIIFYSISINYIL